MLKPHNSGTWTKGQYWSAIRSSLRRLTRSWIPYRQCLLAARRAYEGLNKRQKWEYKCKHCNTWHLRSNVEVDHIKEVGPLNKPEDFEAYIANLLQEGIDSYQVLCKPCHRIKTNANKL